MQLTTIQLRNQVRFKTDISNTTTLSNADILIQLNEGYSNLVKAIVEADQDFLEEQKAKFNLVENCSLVALPTDCIKIKQVRLAYTTPTSESDYRIATSYDPSETQLISCDETNVPVSNPQVDITNNYCRLFPRPSSSVANGGEYYYIARPSALTLTGDVMIIPADYHDLAAVYASSKAMEKFENYNKADRLMQEFINGTEKMKRELAGREMNRSLRFKSFGSSGSATSRRELPS